MKHLLLILLSALALVPAARACDACNLAFADQVLGPRAGTLIGQDLRRAMENQRHLQLEGFSDSALAQVQNAKLGEVPGNEHAPEWCSCSLHETGAVARTAPELSAPAPLPDQAGLLMPDPALLRSPAPIRVAQAKPSRETLPARTASSGRPLPEYMNSHPFIEILERDYALSTTPYSTVPQDAPVDKSFTVTLNEGQTYLGNGIVYDGFLIDGKVPGPTLIVDEGDVVEMKIVNDGDIPHGASIHAAYTQTSKYVGKIEPKTSKSVRFRANTPGVYMYHCAPGGHAIGMHVIGGQYGMIVVKPAPGSYRLEQELGHAPNLELYLIQHELYASGKDSISGQPEYVLFNGRTFRYIEEPILTKPGDYVRIYFLNVGPNILSTFHIVGIIWDHVYWQGHPAAGLAGGQSVTAGPTDAFVIDFRMPPDEGAYTMLTHAVGSTNRGAIGLLVVDAKADLPPFRSILADGPSFSDSEKKAFIKGATRVIAPFGLGTHPEKDAPVVYGPETREVKISIIGNSFHPKVVQITPGTRVTWTNEDVFTYLAGEYAGIHNASATTSPEDVDPFNSPLLAHGESWSATFDTPFTYEYICTPHPYMKGRIIVQDAPLALASTAPGAATSLGGWTLPLLALCLLLASAAFVFRAPAATPHKPTAP